MTRSHLFRLDFLVALTLIAASVLSATAAESPRFPQSDRAERVRRLASEIDEIYRSYAAEEHFPGFAYGVLVDGSLVASGAHGFSDIARQTPASVDTVFRVASMTKSFTAMAVLRLRDAGRFDLDRAADRYLPELRRLPPLTRDAPFITLRHLLTHGAGFPEDNPWGDRQLADSDRDLIDLIRSPAHFANVPGVQYEYSNLGFALLGRAVQRASGISCQSYISRHILRPLGMSSTFWDPQKVPSERLAHGYRWQDGQWSEEALLGDGSYAPMGGMLSSVTDFGRYMALHLSAWPPRDDPDSGPLRRSSIREMHHPWRFSSLDNDAKDAANTPCPIVTAYAYGLAWAQDCRQRTRVGHSGGLPGFGSNWRILPDYGIGVVAMANLTYAHLGPANARVLERIISAGGLLPRERLPSEILTGRARELMNFLPDWTGAEASEVFAENFFPDNPVSSLQRSTRELWSKLGSITAVEPVRPENELRGTFEVRGAQGRCSVFFTLSPENPPRIQHVEFTEIR